MADSVKVQAALKEQRPRRYLWMNAFGKILIGTPLVIKTAGLMLTPGALTVLGGIGPALMVSYVGVAIIHWTTTGYAAAYLRCRKAEKKEIRTVLISSTSPEERAQHPLSVKDNREHHFTSPVDLVPVDNVDGHSLIYDGLGDEGHAYRLVTLGRLDDDDVDTMVARQKKPAQQATLFRECFKHQLQIEESEPLTVGPGQDEGSAPRAATSPVVPINGGFRTEGIGRAAALILASIAALGLGACKPAKPEKTKLQIVTLSQQTSAAMEPLPERIVSMAGPEKPLGGKFVPTPELIRLDTAEQRSSGIEVPVVSGAAGFSFESPELELKKLRDALGQAQSGILAEPTGNPETAKTRLTEWVRQATSEGTYVLAVGSNLKGSSEYEVAPGLKVPAVEKPSEVAGKLEGQLKQGPRGLALILDPPVVSKMVAATPPVVPTPPVQQVLPVANSAPANMEGLRDSQQSPPPDKIQAPGNNTVIVEIRPGAVNAATGPLPPAVAAAKPVGKPEITGLPALAQKVGKIRFEEKARVTESVKRDLTTTVEAMKKMKAPTDLKIFLSASADSRPYSKGNLELSRQRAEVVRAELLEHGFVVTDNNYALRIQQGTPSNPRKPEAAGTPSAGPS